MSQISEVFLFVEKNYFQVEADIEDQIAVHHFLQVLGEAIVEPNLGFQKHDVNSFFLILKTLIPGREVPNHPRMGGSLSENFSKYCPYT